MSDVPLPTSQWARWLMWGFLAVVLVPVCWAQGTLAIVVGCLLSLCFAGMLLWDIAWWTFDAPPEVPT